MTLTQLVRRADVESGILLPCFNPATGRERRGKGSKVARFILREIIESYDPGKNDLEQLQTAAEVMRGARRHLLDVLAALR